MPRSSNIVLDKGEYENPEASIIGVW